MHKDGEFNKIPDEILKRMGDMSKKMKKEDFEKLSNFQEEMSEKMEEESKKGNVIIPIITNHFSSPWISEIYAIRESISESQLKPTTPNYIGAALFYFPEWWLPSPFVPDVGYVLTSKDDSAEVKKTLAYLAKRSFLISGIASIRKNKTLSIEEVSEKILGLLTKNVGIDEAIDPTKEWDLGFWIEVGFYYASIDRDDLTIHTFEKLLEIIDNLEGDKIQWDYSGLLTLLGSLYYDKNEVKKAKTNLIKAIVRDFQLHEDIKKKSSYFALTSYFDFTDTHFDILREITSKSPQSFENLLGEFTARSTELGMKILFDNLFFLDKENVRKQLLDSQQHSLSPYRRGHIFEEMARNLFSAIEGFSVSSKNTKTGQLDGVITNHRIEHPFFQVLGEYFLMEAKNWNKRVSAKEVREFSDKLREYKCKFGIFVTLLGVTGPDAENAKGVIQSTFERDKIAIIVLDQSDIESVVACNNLLILMKEKYESLKFKTG